MNPLDQTSLRLLKNSRLNDKQAKVYLSLLQLGKAPVARIAEMSGLKRSITYVILEELQALGYVSLLPDVPTKKTYTAVDPNALFSQLEQAAQDFREMLPYLRALQRKGGKPYVTYYSGLDGVRTAFAQIRRPKEARYVLSVQQALKFIPEEVARWESIYGAGKARPQGNHLLADTPEDRKYAKILEKAGQLVRFLPADRGFGMDLALVDNTVYLTNFEETIHVTVIESEMVYRSLCLLYDLVWEARG